MDPKYFLHENGDLGYRSTVVSGSYANADCPTGPLLWNSPSDGTPRFYGYDDSDGSNTGGSEADA